MALRPRWRQQPFELLAEANFTGRTTGANYDLLFPYGVPQSALITITIDNLKVYDAAPDDLQNTQLQFQYNGTLYTTAQPILSATRSTLGDLVSRVQLTYSPKGYDLTKMYATVSKSRAWGTAAESSADSQIEITVASPGNTTLTGIRLTHSSGFITNQASIKVYRTKG